MSAIREIRDTAGPLPDYDHLEEGRRTHPRVTRSTSSAGGPQEPGGSLRIELSSQYTNSTPTQPSSADNSDNNLPSTSSGNSNNQVTLRNHKTNAEPVPPSNRYSLRSNPESLASRRSSLPTEILPETRLFKRFPSVSSLNQLLIPGSPTLSGHSSISRLSLHSGLGMEINRNSFINPVFQTDEGELDRSSIESDGLDDAIQFMTGQIYGDVDQTIIDDPDDPDTPTGIVLEGAGGGGTAEEGVVTGVKLEGDGGGKRDSIMVDGDPGGGTMSGTKRRIYRRRGQALPNLVTVPKEELTGEESENLLNEDEEKSRLDHLDWDVFREFTKDKETVRCAGCFKVGIKILKFFFILISFLIILASLVTSKLSLLFVTSNLNPFVGFRKYINLTMNGTNETEPSSCGVPVCFDEEGHDTLEYKDRDMIRWIWSLVLILCTPYILTFLKCMFKIIFKKKRRPTCKALAFVLGIEILHTGGLFGLTFMILPRLDMLRAIFLMNATLLFPSFLKLLLRPRDEPSCSGAFLGDFIAFIAQISAPVLWLIFSIDQFSHYFQCGMGSCDCSMTKLPDVCDQEAQHRLIQRGTGSLYSELSQSNMVHSTLNIGQVLLGPYSADDNSTEMTPPFSFPFSEAPEITTQPQIPTTTEKSITDNSTQWINVTHVMGALPECITDYGIYIIPICLLFISLTWWENFVDDDLHFGKLGDTFRSIRRQVKLGRTKIWAIVSILKVIIIFVLVIIFVWTDPTQKSKISARERIKLLFDRGSFLDHRYTNNYNTDIDIDWLAVFGASAGASFICYVSSLIAIQAKTQRASFSAAILLATPVSIGFSLWICNDCHGNWNLAPPFDLNVELFWNCHSGWETFNDLIKGRYITLVGMLWWVGEMILLRYIWSPNSETLAKAARLFNQDMYCGALIEQSLASNRVRVDENYKDQDYELPPYEDLTIREDDEPYPIHHQLKQMEPLYRRQDLSKPMIFICATMWHEKETEMVQCLKSILRLDRDQCARRLARDHFEIRVPDYYDFEAHIFFDDAFERHDEEEFSFNCGPFLKQIMSAIHEAAKSVHGNNVEIEHPVKIPTPYGGKLVYSLPGCNTITVHMKDIVKIRHRKRWSQVMYLYYLLGHRLWGTNAEKNTKSLIANNTFILTLDGDIDFRPDAVLHLVDLMKRDIKVGAACGRIHPVGSGPLVWYQKFEYSLSHWLQKATEHILGCVLCSPGCFSMFRASALMDDNVMKTYSKRASEAVHYVQYDQGTGEDRWLCTLLLQQGYRVEYSAAADAYTQAPEGFNEFFNQRKRWTPSTFANILDLLQHGMDTVRKNDSINILYIIYQGGLFVSSILGPGTIFLMTAGAFQTAIGMTAIGAFFLVFTPLVVFFFLGFFAKPSIQLGFAAFLSGLFSIAQIVVLVGIVLEIVEDGICSPTSIFLIFTVGIFFISALLHPQEFTNILHGLVYYMAIPTMYMLLIIYSLVNLHNVSWGTREVIKTRAEKVQEQEKELEKAVKKVTKKDATGIAKFFSHFSGKNEEEDGWTWGCGDCCRMMCCPRPGQSPTDARITTLSAQTSALHEQMAALVKDLDNAGRSGTGASQPLQFAWAPQMYTAGFPMPQGQGQDDEEEEDGLGVTTQYYDTTDEDSQPLLMPSKKKKVTKTHKKSATKGKSSKPSKSSKDGSSTSYYPPGYMPAPGYPQGGITYPVYPTAPMIPLQPPLIPLPVQPQAPPTTTDTNEKEEKEDEFPVKEEEEEVQEVHDPRRPFWALDLDLGRGDIRKLPKKEDQFWKDLLDRYLYPLIKDKAHEERVAKKLKGLRNKAVTGFFLLDFLFIVLIQSIQMANDNVAGETSGGIMIRWNCSDPITKTTREQVMEPTGIAFIVIFGIFLLIQFIGMLFHRLFSLIQMVASTTLIQKKEQTAEVKDMINLVKDLAALSPEDEALSTIDENEDAPMSPFSGPPRGDGVHRSTSLAQNDIITRIERDRNKKTYKTMDEVFARQFLALKDILNTPQGTMTGNYDAIAGRELPPSPTVQNTGKRRYRRHSTATPGTAGGKPKGTGRNTPYNTGHRKDSGRFDFSNLQIRTKTRPALPESLQAGMAGTMKGRSIHHLKAMEELMRNKDRIFDENKSETLQKKFKHTKADVDDAKATLGKYFSVRSKQKEEDSNV